MATNIQDHPEHLRKLQVHIYVCKFTTESRIRTPHEEAPALDHSKKLRHQRREQGAKNCVCAKKEMAQFSTEGGGKVSYRHNCAS